jgi:4'-phosphopantetheinyl transferase
VAQPPHAKAADSVDPRPSRRRHTPPRQDLPASDVHIYFAEIDRPNGQIGWLQSLLSPDEIQRAERYHFDVDRRRFIAARGILRLILSQYTGSDPGRIRLSYGRFGKPLLGDARAAPGLGFNLSHAEGVCLVALSRDRQIGIDIVYERRDPQLAEDLLSAFSSREIAILRSLEPEEFFGRLFWGWACKEAILKAIGEGFQISPDRVEVLAGAGEGITRLRLDGDDMEYSGWSFRELRPAPGYVGALAVPGPCRRMQFRKWGPALPDAEEGHPAAAESGRTAPRHPGSQSNEQEEA